ncbi:MAG: GGDEF domain-containing protein [Candidatus Limnocylindrales bacterium]
MDVLSMDITRSVPHGGRRDETLGERLRRLLLDRSRSPHAPGSGSAGGPTADAATAISRRTLLLGFTAAEIVLGLGLLALVTVAVGIQDGINPHLDGTALAGTTGGILLWTMFGLLGSVRSVTNRGGQVHFTFNQPFIGAAMVLGGPTAGAWVAFLSTIERRELESLPWYAIAANHASMVIAAVSGGAVFVLTQQALTGLTGDARTAQFVAIIVAGVALEVVASLLTVATVMLRDQVTRSGILAMLIEDFGRVTIIEIGLIWVLAIAFSQVGWWAPLIVGAIVVVGSRAGPTEGGIDPLTGLLRKPAFDARLARKVGWMRRGILDGGTVMYLDLNDFHAINNQHGHEVGDEALRVIATRIAAVCPRHEDLVSRLMGDEFGIFLAGRMSDEEAMHKAQQIVDAVCRPVPTSVGPMHVGVAVGVAVADGAGTTPSGPALIRWAEQAMYHAKRESGPCGGVHRYSPDDATPFDGEWLESQR